MAQAQAGSGGIWWADPPMTIRATWDPVDNPAHPDYYIGVWCEITPVGNSPGTFPLSYTRVATLPLSATTCTFNPLQDGTIAGRSWVINGTVTPLSKDFLVAVSLVTRATNIAVFPGQVLCAPLTLTYGRCG